MTEHVISVEPQSGDLKIIRCSCGEVAQGQLADILSTWVEGHLLTADRLQLTLLPGRASSDDLGDLP